MTKLRLLISVAVMVAMLMAALPATAFAHDDEDEDVDVGCALTPFDQVLGTDVVDEDKVTNSGASFFLMVTCASGGLDGILITSHGSEVKVDPVTGEFRGDIEGTFVLYALDFSAVIGTGELEADVEGLMFVDGTGPVLDPNGNVMTLSEIVDGDWELEGSGFEAEGEFGLDLDFLDFDPFSPGHFLTGELEFDEDDD